MNTLNLSNRSLAEATVTELSRRGKSARIETLQTNGIGCWFIVIAETTERELVEVAEQQANLL